MKLKAADVPASIRGLDQTRSNFQASIARRARRADRRGALVERLRTERARRACHCFSGLTWLRAQAYGSDAQKSPSGPTKKAPPKRGLEVGGPRLAITVFDIKAGLNEGTVEIEYGFDK